MTELINQIRNRKKCKRWSSSSSSERIEWLLQKRQPSTQFLWIESQFTLTALPLLGSWSAIKSFVLLRKTFPILSWSFFDSAKIKFLPCNTLGLSYVKIKKVTLGLFSHFTVSLLVHKRNDDISMEQSGHLHASSRAPRNSFLRRFPKPSRSIHHGDVSGTLGPRDPRRTGRVVGAE